MLRYEETIFTSSDDSGGVFVLGGFRRWDDKFGKSSRGSSNSSQISEAVSSNSNDANFGRQLLQETQDTISVEIALSNCSSSDESMFAFTTSIAALKSMIYFRELMELLNGVMDKYGISGPSRAEFGPHVAKMLESLANGTSSTDQALRLIGALVKAFSGKDLERSDMNAIKPFLRGIASLQDENDPDRRQNALSGYDEMFKWLDSGMVDDTEMAELRDMVLARDNLDDADREENYLGLRFMRPLRSRKTPCPLCGSVSGVIAESNLEIWARGAQATVGEMENASGFESFKMLRGWLRENQSV